MIIKLKIKPFYGKTLRKEHMPKCWGIIHGETVIFTAESNFIHNSLLPTVEAMVSSIAVAQDVTCKSKQFQRFKLVRSNSLN